MHDKNGKTVTGGTGPLSRPGSRSGEEREHYDPALRRIPGWRRSSSEESTGLWGLLQAGDQDEPEPFTLFSDLGETNRTMLLGGDEWQPMSIKTTKVV